MSKETELDHNLDLKIDQPKPSIYVAMNIDVSKQDNINEAYSLIYCSPITTIKIHALDIPTKYCDIGGCDLLTEDQCGCACFFICSHFKVDMAKELKEYKENISKKTE